MEVKEEVTVGYNIVYVPIKVPVCKHCGERYYDRRTMQFLEGIEEEISRRKVELKEIGKVLMVLPSALELKKSGEAPAS